MLTTVCQRWRDHRGTYRPAGEVIDPRQFEVARCTREAARAFVEAHHYSRSWPAERLSVGLYRGGVLVGVAVASQPMHEGVLAPLPGEGKERAELGRLVLLDEVQGNGESWFLARAFELMAAEGIVSLVSFSDPVPRTDAAGRQVFKGHIGNVYQATNAVYTGRATPATLRLLPSGEVLSPRSIQKIRRRETGWRYAEAQLVEAGAVPMAPGEDPRAWLARELARTCRTFRHRGNHRYLFGLTRAARKALARDANHLPYPKFNLFGWAA